MGSFIPKGNNFVPKYKSCYIAVSSSSKDQFTVFRKKKKTCSKDRLTESKVHEWEASLRYEPLQVWKF